MASPFQNQNQFLGSRISLISKSEIRYEGTLYALDLGEATISLAKVRSFGTEDRPTERPVPPKEDVYEYIIFRGADIKVIDVVEPPKHGAGNGMPPISDPAIVEFSHAGGHYGGHFEGGGRMRPQSNLLDNLFKGRAGGPPVFHGGPQNGGGGPRRRSGGYPDEMRRPRNNMGGGGGGGGGPGNNGGGGRGGGGGGQGYGGPHPGGGRNQFGGQMNPNMWNFRQGGGGYIPNNGGQQFIQRGGRTTTPNRGGNYGQPQRMRGGGDGRQMRGGGGGPGGPGGGGGGNRTPFRARGMNQAAFPPKVAFDGDYDFEKANEELLSTLAKAKIEDENAENKSDDGEGGSKEGGDGESTANSPGKEKTFYKKDNFFDNISCESLERSKGNVPRVDWKAERKLNAETFGLTLNSNNGGNNGNNGNGGNGNMRSGGGGRRGGQRIPRGMVMMNRLPPWMMSPQQQYYRVGGGGGGGRRPRH